MSFRFSDEAAFEDAIMMNGKGGFDGIWSAMHCQLFDHEAPDEESLVNTSTESRRFPVRDSLTLENHDRCPHSPPTPFLPTHPIHPQARAKMTRTAQCFVCNDTLHGSARKNCIPCFAVGKRVVYCSRQCQKYHWGMAHRFVCQCRS